MLCDVDVGRIRIRWTKKVFFAYFLTFEWKKILLLFAFKDDSYINNKSTSFETSKDFCKRTYLNDLTKLLIFCLQTQLKETSAKKIVLNHCFEYNVRSIDSVSCCCCRHLWKQSRNLRQTSLYDRQVGQKSNILCKSTV